MVIRPSILLQPWLEDQGSFMQRLRQQGLCPRVKVLGQYWQYPLLAERALLNIGLRQCAFVREVVIQHDHCSLMFARAVIPRGCVTGPRRQLLYLGEKPLGSFLFNYKGMKRGPFELIYTSIEQFQKEKVWGRRSIFYLKEKQLLLSEFFLPEFYQFL